jgi:hypothetical protein
MSAPDSKVVLFISVAILNGDYLFHGPLHTITPYNTPTNMGASSEELGDTITQAWDFYNNLLNQTIKNLQKQN